MTTTVAPMCVGCSHYRRGSPWLACDAYPTGIPDAILDNQADHRVAQPGDGGIRFDPVSSSEADLVTERFGPVAAAVLVELAYSPNQPRRSDGKFGTGGGGGVGIGVSRERPELGGGEVHTYGDIVKARRNPVIAEAEATTVHDLGVLGISVSSQRQVAGVFEGGGEPSLSLKLGKHPSVEDIDVTGAYMVRRNQQDSVIVNVTGSELKRLGLEPNGTVVRVTGLPTDPARREQIFADVQHHTPFASWDEQAGTVEVSSFTADLTPGLRKGLASLAAAHGGQMTLEPTHTRWYFHDDQTRAGASGYLHPADTSVLRTPDEVRTQYPGKRTDAIPGPRPGSSGQDVGGGGGTVEGGTLLGLGDGPGAVAPAEVAYSPTQPRRSDGKFGTGSGTAPSGAHASGGPSQERLDRAGADVANPNDHGQEYETAVVLRADGSEAFRKTQHDPSTVTFTDDEMASMKDTAIVHNHPSGSALSSMDVGLALDANAESIHAYGLRDTESPDGTYTESRTTIRSSIHRPEDGWDTGRARMALSHATDQTRAYFNKTIAKAGGDPERTRAAIYTANHQHAAKVMKRMQELYNGGDRDLGYFMDPLPASQQLRYEEGTW